MAPGKGPDVRATRPDQTETFETSHVFAQGQIVAGRYRIVRFIARGGMGEVYEAFDEKLRIKLALKTLRPEYSSDSAALIRFRREICLAREVAHEHLCHVYDLVEHRWTGPGGFEQVISCLTMQLLEGESLADYIAKHRPMQTETALPVVAQIASALDHLHKHGIIHRDLKPSNVLLTRAPDGAQSAVLMDFGLAKPSETAPDQFETIGPPVGTPYFMAPETMRGERPTAASDIYAFGLLIDEMVTRSRAFPVEPIEGLGHRKLYERPSPPSARSSNLPGEWEETILRCLASEPACRPESAGAVYRGLSAGADLETTLDSKAAPTIAAHVSIWRPTRRRISIAVLALVLIVTLGTTGTLASRPLAATMAVFETANLTSRSDYDYVCKGMTEELVRRLIQMRGLSVIQLHETRGRKRNSDIQAGFVLDSSLQESGGRVRFSVELTRQRDSSVVWAHYVDREVGDQLDTQSYVTRQIAEALEAQALFGGSAGAGRRALATVVFPIRRVFGFQNVARPPTARRAAFDAYMRGRHLWDERTLSSSLGAIKEFERALAEDPGFALAYAALADVDVTLVQFNHAPALQLLGRARENARKAVEAGPEVAETYVSLAAVQQHLWDWKGSEESYRKAISLNPGLAQAHQWYAGLVLQLGRLDEALQQAGRALDLDPYNDSSRSAYGYCLFFAGRNEQAARYLEQFLEQRDFLYARVNLAHVYAKLGSVSTGEQAAAYFDKAFAQARIIAAKEMEDAARIPGAPGSLRYTDEVYARLYAMTGRRAEGRRHLDKMLREMEAGRMSPAVVAEIYTALGENETALDLLEKATDERDPEAAEIRVNPFFEPLRGSERFKAILERMQL